MFLSLLHKNQTVDALKRAKESLLKADSRPQEISCADLKRESADAGPEKLEKCMFQNFELKYLHPRYYQRQIFF